jgi:hypothetical protein
MVTSFEFQREHDGSLSLDSAVFQALGAASTCWESLEGAGIFDSTRAREIGDALLSFIRSESRPAISPGALCSPTYDKQPFDDDEEIGYEGTR